MAIKSYVLKENYKAPVLRYTGLSHAPQQLQFKQFLKNDIVQGELKHSMNKPIGVIVMPGMFFPLQVLKEVVTKEIVSDASGESISTITEKIKTNVQNSDPKVQYIDYALAGAVVGLGVVFALGKYNVIPTGVTKVHYAIGAGIGSSLFTYIKWRANMNKKFKKE